MESKLFKELTKVALDYCANEKRIGEILVQMEEAHESVRAAKAWLKTHAKIPAARADCLMRWARGELGSDLEAMSLLHGLPAATVAELQSDAITTLLNEPHAIVADPASPQQFVEKTWSQMTDWEKRHNIGPQGIKPLNEPESKTVRYRRAVCAGVRCDEPGKIMLYSMHREQFQMEARREHLEAGLRLLDDQRQQDTPVRKKRRRAS